MSRLLKLDVISVAESWSNATVNSERTPLVIALGNWNSKVLVFRVPSTLLNQLGIESSPERSH